MSDTIRPKINCVGKTDQGRKRHNNEDSFILEPELNFCALADGMGGASAGEMASSIFTDSAFEVFSNANRESEQEVLHLVKKTFQRANEKILINVAENPGYRGMGCTAELLAFFNQTMVLGHVGDSRTYILRQNMFKQLTRDHSLVQNQLDQGIITKEQAKTHNLRHIILKAVGVKEDLEVDIIKGRAVSGDIYLLCSDGLTDMLEDTSIRDTLSLPLTLDQRAHRLIALANDAGGSDNITVILCQVM